jgi:catalase
MPSEAPSMPTEDQRVEGVITRQKISVTNDFEQAGQRYRSLGKNDQDHLVDNIVDSLKNADKPIQERMVNNLTKAEVDFGERVKNGLEI